MIRNRKSLLVSVSNQLLSCISVHTKGRVVCMTALLLLLMLTPFCSLRSEAQVRNGVISFKAEGKSLTYAFKKLEKATSYKVSFLTADVAPFKVNRDVKARNINEAMEQIIGNNPLSFSIDGQFVIVTKGKQKNKVGDKLKRVLRRIDGCIYDVLDKSPLTGAWIKIVGDDQAMAVSDMKGYFSMEVPANEEVKIQISYVGMETQTLIARENMVIYMHEDSKQIDEVVVTGIFQRARESYTGAVTSIDKEDLEMYRGTNLLQTLKNADASINFPINNVAGSNPNVLPNLNIRGSSSLPMSVEEFNQDMSQTVNAPLIILDGFEISLTKLMDYNDEQIESINILKDAAATAIYGSRGANGVIVVVTKRPKEGRLKATVRAGLTLELPDLSSYHLLNAEQKLELERLVGLYTDTKSPANQEILNGYYAERKKAIALGTDVDWMSKPLRNGVGQRYNVQLDGGSREFQWGVALGYNDVAGAMKGSSRRTINGDITLLYSVKNFIFRNYTSITSNNSKESPYGSFQDYVDQEPYNNPFDEDGNLVKYFYDYNHASKIGNPLYDATLNTIDKSSYLNLTNNFSIEWQIIEGLRMRASLGVTTNRSNSDKFLPPSHSTFNSSTYETESGQLRKGRYTYNNGNDNQYSTNVTLSYSKLFAEKHQMYVGLNYNLTESNSTSYGMVGEGFSNDNLDFISNAYQYQLNGSPSGSRTKTRMVGVTGNANYTFDNRYYVDLSYRVDGNSKFGADNRFAPFWSIGLGWNLHNEKFIEKIKQISNLRLKASYGVTGSQDISTESIYTTYQYPSGSRYIGWTSATVLGLGNSELTWQSTKEYNLGLEFGLFDNRLTGQLDVYSKRTTNLLSSMDLPLATGFSSYTANVGELKNNGFEASLNAYMIRDHKRKINLILGAQLVYDWNEIARLSDAILEQNQNYLAQNVEVANLFYVGRPMNAIYAVRSKGIDPSSGEEVFIDKDGNTTNTWSASDEVYLGPSQPLYRGNFRTTLMWKNLTVNVSFGYHWGGKMYNSTLSNRVEVSKSTIGSKNVDERVLNARWLNIGDVTFFRNFDDNYATHATSRYVFDENVLELQSVNVQYRWNTSWLKKNLRMESMLFSLNMSNVAYWSSVKYERGTSYPYARNIQASVTLNF